MASNYTFTRVNRRVELGENQDEVNNEEEEIEKPKRTEYQCYIPFEKFDIADWNECNFHNNFISFHSLIIVFSN